MMPAKQRKPLRRLQRASAARATREPPDSRPSSNEERNGNEALPTHSTSTNKLPASRPPLVAPPDHTVSVADHQDQQRRLTHVSSLPWLKLSTVQALVAQKQHLVANLLGRFLLLGSSEGHFAQWLRSIDPSLSESDAHEAASHFAAHAAHNM